MSVSYLKDSTGAVQPISGPVGPVGPQGPQGGEGPAGPGFAPGGVAGQFVRKASTADYDTEWSNAVVPADKDIPGGYAGLDSSGKVLLQVLPDSILGQMVHAGDVDASTAVATLTTAGQEQLGTTDTTIVLTNDTAPITGYTANQGNYYLVTVEGTFAAQQFNVGDWLIANASGWGKVDNTDEVTGVKGNAESTYRVGNVNITKEQIGIQSSTAELEVAIAADGHMSVNNLQQTLGAIHNRIYEGVDLTAKFAAEIAAAPYSGDPWAWIKARIQAADWQGILVGDYIPFKSSNNYNIKAEIAGIDTYYRYGDTEIGHHIDFISRDCWPETHVFNKVNYNNGTSWSGYPWLASDLYAWMNSLSMQVPNAATANPALVAVDYTATGVYDKFPAALKAVITPKRVLLSQRYTAGSLLTSDNNWGWRDAGNLWIPSEIEVYGCEHWGSKNGYSSGGFQQYPIFANNMKRIKGAGDGGGRAPWWLSSPDGGSSSAFAHVSGGGDGGSATASNTGVRVPVDFRIRAA